MHDDLQALIDRATPAPDHVPDFAELADRARRRTTLGVSAIALVGVMVLVVGAIAWWPTSVGVPAVDDVPTGSDVAAPALPAGWQELTLAGGSFGVPGDWQVTVVDRPLDTPCINLAESPTVYLAPDGLAPTGCPARELATTVVTVQPLTGPSEGEGWQPVTTVGGVQGRVRPIGSDTFSYEFVSLDVAMTVVGVDSDTIGARIADTVAPANTPRSSLTAAPSTSEDLNARPAALQGCSDLIDSGGSLAAPDADPTVAEAYTVRPADLNAWWQRDGGGPLTATDGTTLDDDGPPVTICLIHADVVQAPGLPGQTEEYQWELTAILADGTSRPLTASPTRPTNLPPSTAGLP